MLGKNATCAKGFDSSFIWTEKGRSESTNGASKFMNCRYKVPYLEVQIQPRPFSNLNIPPVRVFNENVEWMHQRAKCMNVSVVGSGRRRRQSPGSSSLHFFFPSLPASWKSAGGSPSGSEQAQPRLLRGHECCQSRSMIQTADFIETLWGNRFILTQNGGVARHSSLARA